ncbi:MAG: hypothetical protein R2744_12795 [Bacteroidales bacterium]
MSVLVYTENWDGKFKKLSFELVTYASKLASMMNTEAIAVSIGDVEETELKRLAANYGASRIITVNDSKFNTLDSQAFSGLLLMLMAGKTEATVIVVSNNQGKSIASRLSVRLRQEWEQESINCL